MTLSADSSDRVLVVEDDDDIRDLLSELLEEQGYEVTTARDGEEAVQVIDAEPPALVISDVRMPRRDGFELVHALRERRETADVPILLLSANTRKEEFLDGLERGADDYLEKPIDPVELLARVRVHLRHAHRRQELERRTLIDPLTGVLNRRGLMEAIRHEHERVHRVPGTHMSVLLIDVDRFKTLNDTLGHNIGDQVLKRIADALVEAVRAVDHVGRLGGDEFVVVTPDADLTAANALANRLADLAIEPLAVDGQDVKVTVSVGVASLIEGETIDELIGRADTEMYQRKRQRKARAS